MPAEFTAHGLATIAAAARGEEPEMTEEQTLTEDEQEAIHGDRQCEACGDWLPVTGTAERPCACGLVLDNWALSHRVALTVRDVYVAADHASFSQTVILRHNLTVIATMAEEAAKAIDLRLRASTECAHCGLPLVHVHPDNWEHQASGSQWCTSGMRERAVPVLP